MPATSSTSGARRCAEGVGGHRQGPVCVPVHEHVGGRAGRRGQPGDVDKREEVLRGRYGVPIVGVVPQCQHAGGRGRHVRPGGIVEPAGPVEPSVGLAPVDAAQVMDHVPAADDQHTSGAQRCELRPELEVVVEGFLGVDRTTAAPGYRLRGRRGRAPTRCRGRCPSCRGPRRPRWVRRRRRSRRASSGSPGAGYSTANSASGKP